MVKHICENVFHTSYANALKKTISYLIAKWIRNNYAIRLFPWYFTNSPSHNDFLLDENDSIAIAVLRHAPNMLHEYLEMMQEQLLESILSKREVNCTHAICPLPMHSN